MSDPARHRYAGGSLLAISICFIVLDTIFIVARLVARKRVRDAPWGWDDFLAIAGYIACIAMCAVGLCFVIYAKVGYDVQEAVALNSNAMVNWAKLIIALEVVYTTAISCTKLSVLCLWHRIFITKPCRIAIVSLMVLVVMAWIGIMLAGILECIPTGHLWDKSKPGKCFNTEVYFEWGPLPGLIIDVLILAVPLVTVWRLNAPTGRKIDLTIMFLLGGLGLLACIARIALFWTHSAYSDPTYASWYLVGISVIEPSFYLIACCLVAMRPLMPYIFDKVAPRSWNSSFHALSRPRTAKNDRGLYTHALHDAGSQSSTAEHHSSWSDVHLPAVSRAYMPQSTAGNV